jgi:hypothetical protein
VEAGTLSPSMAVVAPASSWPASACSDLFST